MHFESLKAFWSLDDARFDDYLDKRFYQSVLQCMLFNLTHPDCPWTKNEKQYEINKIMDDALTQKCFKYAASHINSLEHRLYRRACLNRNQFQISIYGKLFGTLHLIRNKIMFK